jgi:hypothetical protein
MNNGSVVQQVEQAHHIKENLCKAVKQEVEEAFGHTIATSRDCNRLSEEIFYKTSFKINPNTLRRFFGLVKALYPPSLSTLTILANYCGYHSLEELSAVKNGTPAKEATQNDQCILQYLVTLLTDTPAKGTNDVVLLTVVKHTIKFLSQFPELANRFQRAIAKTKNGQAYYFEQFVYTDKLNSFYGEGLRYYLSEKKTAEAQVFGYSLLCLRDWLVGNTSSLKRNFETIKSQRLSKHANPYVSGCYYSASLLYAEASNLDTQRILAEAYKVHLDLKLLGKSQLQFWSFEYAIAHSLVLTRHYQDALYYINQASLNNSESPNPLDNSFYHKLTLLKAIAFAQSGILDEAEKLLDQIRTSQFNFLSKKADTILYLLLTCFLKKANKKLEKQLTDLIDETGFARLRSVDFYPVEDAIPVPCEQK